MAHYRTAIVGGTPVHFLAAHRARQKRLQMLWQTPQNRWFSHSHPAVGIAERTPEGCVVLHLRPRAPDWRRRQKYNRLNKTLAEIVAEQKGHPDE